MSRCRALGGVKLSCELREGHCARVFDISKLCIVPGICQMFHVHCFCKLWQPFERGLIPLFYGDELRDGWGWGRTARKEQPRAGSISTAWPGEGREGPCRRRGIGLGQFPALAAPFLPRGSQPHRGKRLQGEEKGLSCPYPALPASHHCSLRWAWLGALSPAPLQTAGPAPASALRSSRGL